MAAVVSDRLQLFKKFRDGGWQISVLNPAFTREFVIQKDNWLTAECHFLVKMPGAHPMVIKTVSQLLRLVNGVGA